MEYIFRAFILLFIIYNLVIISLFFWLGMVMRNIQCIMSKISINTQE